MLHGFGSNETDLIGLAPYLDPSFTIVSARAPYELEWGGYAWFELEFSAQGSVTGRNEEQLELSHSLLCDLVIDATKVYSTDPRQVYLMGFSQGAMMSAYIAITHPQLFAGAILMSGAILPYWKPPTELSETLKHMPMIVVHGTEDTVLPISNGRASQRYLQTLGVPVEYYEYSMGHAISDESITQIDEWLTRQVHRHRPETLSG
jgi:phospholipase/carboxylesterase